MKKKKKILFLTGAAVVAAALIFVLIYNGSLKKNESANSSRRDDSTEFSPGTGDDDLLLMDGGIEENNSDHVLPAPGKKIEENLLGESILSDNVNCPLVDEVQVVRKLALPEAVTVEQGDADAFYGNDEFLDVTPVDYASFSEDDLPSKYDSRNVDGKCYITDVEDQGYTYLCWAFAALGACESDILRHHDNLSHKDLDLSEKHLAYYNVHKAEGSGDELIDSDYRELVNPDNEENAWLFGYDTGYLAVGGVTDFCISILTAWKGPVDEVGIDKFKGLYGNPYVFTENTDKPSDAYLSNYHVQGAYEIPATIENNELIKHMVMEHGSATVGVDASDEFWKKHKTSLYSEYEGKTALTANHEVLIVGWDDEYSASNFSINPGGDGAWICKNSWGSSIGDGGYFYLSYYDETAEVSNAVSYRVAVSGDKDYYDNNYQTAGFFTDVVSSLDDSLNTVNAFSGSANPYGVLYTAKGDEILKAVGLMSLDQYQQYEIDIFINPETDGDTVHMEKQELPVLSQKISAISGGYHTFALDSEIELDSGDEFLILIRPETMGRLPFEQQNDFFSEKNYDEWNNLTGSIHNHYEASGLCFYISDDGRSMERQTDKDFLIKAYTVNR